MFAFGVRVRVDISFAGDMYGCRFGDFAKSIDGIGKGELAASPVNDLPSLQYGRHC